MSKSVTPLVFRQLTGRCRDIILVLGTRFIGRCRELKIRVVIWTILRDVKMWPSIFLQYVFLVVACVAWRFKQPSLHKAVKPLRSHESHSFSLSALKLLTPPSYTGCPRRRYLLFSCISVLHATFSYPIFSCNNQFLLVFAPLFLPQDYLNSDSAFARSTVVTAVKFTISDHVCEFEYLYNLSNLWRHDDH